MKILQVIPYFFISWAKGQPAVVTYPLSRKLVERGHDVTIYTTDAFAGPRTANATRPKVEDRALSMNGIDICEFESLKIMASIFHTDFYISPSMVCAVRNNVETFDVIHLHQYRTFQNIVVSHYAIKKGIPYIIQAHGSLPLLMANQRQKRLYDMVWGRRLLKCAAKVIAMTSAEVKQYMNMGVSQHKIAVVPNAIDISDFNELPVKGNFRIKYGLDSNEKIVLFLARIHELKGLDLLAEAFAELLHEIDNTTLVVAGPDYGYLHKLKKIIEELQIEDKVLFAGPLYGRGKLEAYVDADVYILPSIYETFPATVLEACACGTPVIVTNRCGIAGIIDGQMGYAVPVDKHQLKAAIMMLLSNGKMRQKFGKQGRSLVQERFTWSKIAMQLESIYLSCL